MSNCAKFQQISKTYMQHEKLSIFFISMDIDMTMSNKVLQSTPDAKLRA